ncbi:MAG: A24 family peptidase [Gammaproteobacteria bacterium]|nr:A24 family peptidase [Gammaproteobacteria bacterium]
MSVRSTSFGGCLLLLLIVAGDFQLGSKPSSQSVDCDHQVKNVRADDQGKAEPKFNTLANSLFRTTIGFIELIENLYSVFLPGLLFFSGLFAGGLLNVIIECYPIYLKKIWLAEAYEEIGDFEQASLEQPRPIVGRVGFDFRYLQCLEIRTCSCCFSYVKCVISGKREEFFGGQYPFRACLVELITGLLWVLNGHMFGFCWLFIPMLVLMSGLIVLAFIDFEHFILPDQIVFPLLFLGLLVNTQSVIATSATSAIVGTVAGYLSLWIIRIAFRWFMPEQEGLGLGDCKMFAAIGAWLGWQHLITACILSAFSCLGFIVVVKMMRENDEYYRFAFGPWISFGAIGTICFSQLL